jgi:hypothetical protein
MESSLHRQLKEHYAGGSAELEVKLGDYRIDVMVGDQLIEIQHGSLSAIRQKVKSLLREHCVTVVKPIIQRKRIIKQQSRNGPVVSRRWSPKRGAPLNLFDDLVYFTNVFPHPNLTLETPLVEIDEFRYPGHGRRRRWRANDFQVEDQRLVEIGKSYRYQRATDLFQLVPRRLPRVFHTGHLAERMGVERWVAQRIAYCMRETGAITQVGKEGNARLYQRAA